MPRNIIVPAIKGAFEDQIFYVGLVSAKKLFAITEVSRVDDDPAKGYQRLLGTTRAKKIAEYIDEGYLLPGALVLSAQEGAIKKYDEKTKKLTLNNQPKSLLVIDGQHRLYGAHQAQSDIPLSVFILSNLRREEEVQYFLDINGLQRGVPKTLRLELTKFTAEPESKEDQLLRIFSELDENVHSPMCGKMTRTRSVSGKISHVAFQSAVGGLIDKAPMVSFNYDQKVQVILNFLQAVEETLVNVFGDASRISNSAFFQAVMSIFVDVCDLSYRKHGDYKKDSIKICLAPLSNVDFDRFSGTNKKAIKELGEEMRKHVFANEGVSDDLF